MRPNANIFLVGLPGAGVSFIQAALNTDFGLKTKDFSQFLMPGTLKNANFVKTAQAWLVLDVSSKIPPIWAQDWLKQAVLACDLVIYNRVENSPIELQMQWQVLLKSWRASLPPVVRYQNQQWPKNFIQKPESLLGSSNTMRYRQSLMPLQWSLETFEFQVTTLNIDFFWQGFEAGVQNLGMQIYRVTGCVQALDYGHCVSIEGTASGLIINPIEGCIGHIVVTGKDLNLEFIQEIVLQKG